MENKEWIEYIFYGLFCLEIFDFENKKRTWFLYFSLNKFYYELFDLIKKVI